MDCGCNRKETKSKSLVISEKQVAFLGTVPSVKKDNTKNKSLGLSTDKGLNLNGKIQKVQGGDIRDTNDHARLRQGREKNTGFHIGKYIQSPPMLFNRDGHALYMADMYKGRPAFIIAGGPSFKDIDNTLLNKAGCLTLGINNSPKTFRPNLWVSVDSPGNFIKSIWLDPKITKFVPFCHAEKKIFDNENWQEMKIKVGDCPNVWFYRRNEQFKAKQFLWEDTFNWGNHTKIGGGRSVLLVAVRLMFYLGIRKLFLLGIDMKMSEDYTYHFDQSRAAGSVKGNNSTYEKLTKWFTELKPIFDKNEFEIYNCNPDSALKVFPFIDYNEAIGIATSEMPLDLSKERTEGLYNRKTDLKTTKNEIKNNI